MSKSPIMTFPIKKRISTEPFTDSWTNFISKWEPTLSGYIEEGKMLAPGPIRGGN